MTGVDFRAAGSVADGLASAGQRKYLSLNRSSAHEELPTVYRAAISPGGEDVLVQQILSATRPLFPERLVLDYYVSLKVAGFVVLAGPAGSGKIALAQRFARAIVGAARDQYQVIAGGQGWTRHSNRRDHYRALHERFNSLRFLDMLHEAALPGNLGKPYFICLTRLQPDELTFYVTRLLRVSPDGERRLALPGLPADRQPVLPPNVLITATLDVADPDVCVDPPVARRVRILEMPFSSTPPEGSAIPVPPVGYQRLLLAAPLRDFSTAWAALEVYLADWPAARLPAWRGQRAEALLADPGELQATIMYAANCFDQSSGAGLFDPHDPLNNLRLALGPALSEAVVAALDRGRPGSAATSSWCA